MLYRAWMTVILAVVFVGICVPDEKKPFRLMTKERDEFYRKVIPKFQEDTILKLLKSSTTFYYTDIEIPKAHQDFEGVLQGIHDSLINVSAAPGEKQGNGNKEFPWGTPAGTHLCDGVTTCRFISLPTANDGTIYPIVYFQIPKYEYGMRILKDGSKFSRDDSRNSPGWAWMFPKGTVVGEILMINDSKGRTHVFEVRIRTRQLDTWSINVYRPFPTAKDLMQALKRKEWLDRPTASTLIKHLDNQLSTDIYTLADSQPDKTIFNKKKHQDSLPKLDEDIVSTLLDETPFVSALGVTWRGDGELAPHAPTTDADYHIVPKKYTAGFIDVSSKSCMACHSGTNQHVDEFDVRRDWYGRIRGSDGIFSFHPFDPAIVPKARGVAVKFNQQMINAGIIAEFDERKHLDAIYRRIKGVQ